MSKHTPGPWRIGTAPPNGEQTVGTMQGLMVAVATTGVGVSEETLYNASLIASAPELLEALEEITTLAAGPVGGVTVQMKRDILAKARAAIAKARGEA